MEEAFPDLEPEPQTRPTGISVVAVLALIFGFFNFICAPISIGQIAIMSDPVHLAMRNDPLLFYSTVVGGAVGWFVSLGLIALGFGLWKLKKWARSGMVIFSIASAIWTVVGGVFNLIYVTPKAMALGMAASGQKAATGMLDTMLTITYVASGIMLVAICASYIALAIYLSRRDVKDVFKELDVVGEQPSNPSAE